ncbi:MAG: bifunctional hydroxymethylpyrimidine kinase/phosphomethylpyrimidine kinase [Propionibacteriaceae bacterium]|nr:bifunctional hydroxymethylpyrimidine kinase/phosphomethylpyrimidine kinase [Propionibacteriaceae bacterium]
MSVLIHVGNAVVDLVLTVAHAPARGGDVLAEEAIERVGGGFNVMAAAARQGMAVAYAGLHGTGPRGDLVRAALAAEGITLLQPALPDRDTGVVVAIVEADGERSFITAPGAEARLTAADLARVAVQPEDFVYLTGYSLAHPANAEALLHWLPGLGSRPLVLFDPGPLVGSLPRAALAAVLDRADWVSANAAEAAALTGSDDPARAAVELLARTNGAGVVVRCGAAGCQLALRGAGAVPVPAFSATVVDLNGAGDAHAGAFIAQLARGEDPLPAARWANVAAGLAVTRRGPATAPTFAEVAAHLGRA